MRKFWTFWFVKFVLILFISIYFLICVCVCMTKASSDPGFYFIDCAFSVLIIGTLVIFVWRCMFALCDLLIYPTDINLSAWYSLVSVPNYNFHFVIVHYSCEMSCESVLRTQKTERRTKKASNFPLSNQLSSELFPCRFWKKRLIIINALGVFDRSFYLVIIINLWFMMRSSQAQPWKVFSYVYCVRK